MDDFLKNLLFAAVIPLAAGFLLDCAVGDPHCLSKIHPISIIGRLIAALEKAARRLFEGNLVIGGLLVSLIVLVVSAGVPLGLLILCYRANFWLGVSVEAVLCCPLLAARSLFSESMKVYDALDKDDTEGARRAVSMIVGRDTAVLDRNGITRAAVETVAENTSDGVTAPLMFIALGGAPLGFFYKAANTMDSMLGYTNEKYRDIGRIPAKLDDILNFIPSRLTALLMILAAGIRRYDMKGAWTIWKRDRRNHASPNSAQTESVCAGALGVRLAGDAYYFGELHKKPYIGDPVREIEKEDIVRANRLMYLTSVLMLVLCVLAKWGAFVLFKILWQ